MSAISASAYVAEPQIRHNLLQRLHWDVAGSLDSVEIAASHLDGIINENFLANPLADEPLYETPCSHIEVSIRDFWDKRGRDMYYPEEMRYKPPPSLEINNNDGSPITLRQFVTEFHHYVAHNLEELKRVMSEMYGERVTRADGSYGYEITYGRPARLPDNLRIYFAFVMAFFRPKNGKNVVEVTLIAEGGSLWSPNFWENKLRNIARGDEQRAGEQRSLGNNHSS